MFTNNTMRMEDSLETLEAMLHQEGNGYQISQPFLGNLPQHTTAFGQPVDACAREAIAQWCYKIMTICHYTNETAEIAVSCLDRFTSSAKYGYQSLLDRQQYQLAALTCVYTAVKIHEQQALSPDLVAKLSNGVFTKEHIEAMELRVLKGLKWRVNPATTMDFVRTYLSLVPHDVLDCESRKLILELSQYQVDKSILDYHFCNKKKSNIALAALLNSIESIYTDGMMGSYVESLISHYANMDTSSLQLLSEKLYEAIANDPEASKMLQANTHTRKATPQTFSINKWALAVKPAPHSPRSVSMA